MPVYKNNIHSKLPAVGTTIFSVMSALANKHNAVNLSQGFPDFAVAPELIDHVYRYMKKGKNQYASMLGVIELREAIANKVERLYSIRYNPETEINITAGATQAIFTIITAFVGEGDEVIIFTPAYDCYEPAIELAGGKAIHVELKTPNYSVDWDEVKKLVNHRTRMIVINTPHNPTGSIFSEADMMELERLTKDSEIIVLSDEVYEHIIFDGQKHQSACRFPDLANRSFIVASFGKTFHATGWKMGYCLGPENLMVEFRKSHQFVVFTCNTPVQYALADYINREQSYAGLNAFYQQKRDRFLDLMKDSRFKEIKSYGTYFQLLDYSSITEERDTEFAIRLTKEFGVASIPISVFYHEEIDNKALRFCFAKNDDTLQQAAEILCKI